MDEKNYIVLKKDGVGGLTVGSYSLPPGRVFNRNDWPYGDKALAGAIENKRCKLVGKKSDSKKVDKKPDNKGDEK